MKAETFNGVMKQVSRLTLRQRALLKKRLDERDEQQRGLAVIESQSATQPRCCPHCQGTSLYLHGQASGLQRYRCQTCQRTFNALAGTAQTKWLNGYCDGSANSFARAGEWKCCNARPDPQCPV